MDCSAMQIIERENRQNGNQKGSQESPREEGRKEGRKEKVAGIQHKATYEKATPGGTLQSVPLSVCGEGIDSGVEENVEG
jgi:predicted transposase YdaD